MANGVYGPSQPGNLNGAIDFIQWLGNGVKEVFVAKSTAEAAAENRKDTEEKTRQLDYLERTGYRYGPSTQQDLPSWAFPSIAAVIGVILLWKVLK